jgi:hypothetical protein
VGDFDPATGGGFSSGHPGLGVKVFIGKMGNVEYFKDNFLKISIFKLHFYASLQLISLNF